MGEQQSTGADAEAASRTERSAGLGLAFALAAVAAVGAGIVIQQMVDRRLTRPEIARLKFYRYLRERGRLES